MFSYNKGLDEAFINIKLGVAPNEYCFFFFKASNNYILNLLFLCFINALPEAHSDKILFYWCWVQLKSRYCLQMFDWKNENVRVEHTDF